MRRSGLRCEYRGRCSPARFDEHARCEVQARHDRVEFDVFIFCVIAPTREPEALEYRGLARSTGISRIGPGAAAGNEDERATFEFGVNRPGLLGQSQRAPIGAREGRTADADGIADFRIRYAPTFLKFLALIGHPYVSTLNRRRPGRACLDDGIAFRSQFSQYSAGDPGYRGRAKLHL